MKYWISYCLIFLAYINLVQAQLNNDDYASQDILMQNQEQDGKPFAVSTTFDFTGPAKFKHEHCKEHLDDVKFGIVEVDVSSVIYYDPCHQEALTATIGYTYTNIDWKNPFFRQHDFNTVSIAIGGFSKRDPCWRWAGQVQVNADINGFHLWDYITVDMILAGRYTWNECVGLHIGFIALTGMKIDHIYPIIGFDWRINEHWKLNAVYPLNISLLYIMNEQWSVGIAQRNFEVRHRVDHDNHLKRGLIQYQATGIEAGIYYLSCDQAIEANLHVGEILGGKVKVANEHHKHSKRFRFKTAPYFGGDLAYRF